MALLDNFHIFLALFLGASCWNFISTFKKIWFNCAILISFFYYLFDIMHTRENVFALCFLFHFLLCKSWCHVCICFIHFCYTTSLLDNIILHCIMYYSFCVDFFIMKSCLACSLIFFVSFYSVGIVCYGEVLLSPT
jgi:hypothetical protein